MRTTRWMLLALLMVGLTTGCGDQSAPDDGGDDAQNGKSDNFGEGDDRVVKTWDLDALAEEGYREDPSVIQAARIEGDELVIDVRYGGGCEEHGWRLHWDGLVLESFPPQANLTLYHDFNNDFCEALKSDELRFDVSGLAGGEIILNLTGTDHSVSYVSEGGTSAKGLYTGEEAELENRGFRADGGIIESASVDGTILTLDVAYGGGCEDHEFELHWSGVMLESLPLQTSLTLYHNSNNDFCEAFLHETLTFDLAELGDGDIIVGLAGSDHSVTLGDVDRPDLPDAKPLYTDDPDALSLQGFRAEGAAIQAAAIEDGKLALQVGYGGGCEEHEFELVWDGTVLESLPSQVSLTLHHNSNGDACEAFLTEILMFDLEALGGGPLIIHLDGADVESVMLE